MILPITLTIAGAAALLNVWLGYRTSRIRIAERISVGDGDHDQLRRRMRAHANFAEYTPFVLILIAAIELAGGTELWLWIVGALYILARIAHAFGMDGAGGLRRIGAIATALALLGLGLYAIAIPYLAVGHVVATDLVALGGN